MKNYDIDIQMIFFFWIEINLFYNSNCDRMRQLISTDHVENFLQFIRWRVSVFPGKSPALNPTWNSYFFLHLRINWGLFTKSALIFLDCNNDNYIYEHS